MAGLDPWTYAERTRNEYAEQVALFMWANMAERFGLKASLDKSSYTLKGQAQAWLEGWNDKLSQLHWLHAIKNQGHGDAVRGAMSKAEGVKAGAPDMMLPVPRVDTWDKVGHFHGARNDHGLYIELKRLKSDRGAKGTASEVQNEWHDYLRSVGYRVEVCYGWEAARDVILNYLGVK